MMPPASCADIPGIKAAGDGGIGCAFDDGAAIGEEGEFVGIAPELQDKVVVFDLSMRLEAARHFGEVHGALALVNLDGVASTQRNLRAMRSGEVRELAFNTCLAIGTRMRSSNFGVIVGPDVKGKLGAAQLVTRSG